MADGDSIPLSADSEQMLKPEKNKEDGGETKLENGDMEAKTEPGPSSVESDKKTTDGGQNTLEQDGYTDVLGNGTLLKKVLEPGSGRPPLMLNKVVVKVEYHLPELEKVLPEEELEFMLGEGDVVQALDLVVALMNEGETAQVIAGFKYMYGEAGLPPDVPPKANFMLIVKLISVEHYDYSLLNTRQLLEYGLKKKARGNYLFQRKEFERSIHSYALGSKLLDPSEVGNSYAQETDPDVLQQILELRAILYCNTASALCKLEAYEGAASAAQESINLLPSHAKGYLRLGQAQDRMGQIDEAIKSYKLALKADSENLKWLHGELARLSKVNKENKSSQQQMYAKMFWGSNPPPVSNSNNKSKPSPAKPSSSSSMGSTVLLSFIGAGVVAGLSFGLYKYMHQ